MIDDDSTIFAIIFEIIQKNLNKLNNLFNCFIFQLFLSKNYRYLQLIQPKKKISFIVKKKFMTIIKITLTFPFYNKECVI